MGLSPKSFFSFWQNKFWLCKLIPQCQGVITHIIQHSPFFREENYDKFRNNGISHSVLLATKFYLSTWVEILSLKYCKWFNSWLFIGPFGGATAPSGLLFWTSLMQGSAYHVYHLWDKSVQSTWLVWLNSVATISIPHDVITEADFLATGNGQS